MPMTTTVDTLVNFFTGQGAFDGLGVQQMKDWYEWRGLDYEETVRLKKRWVQQWRKASAEERPERDRLRAELARAIVVEWGGVRGNKPATLNRYIEDMDKELEEIPLQGIASRSKLLPLRDPKRYVIMDARAVIALNSAQILEKPDKGTMFPELPSKNMFFHRGGPNGYPTNPAYRPRAVVTANPDWRLVQRTSAYKEYIDLLGCVSCKLKAQGIDHTLPDLEMTLFAQVIKVVRRLERRNVKAG